MTGDSTYELEIHLLGKFRVEQNGQLIPDSRWGRNKTKRLLQVLLTDRGAALSCEQLIEILFPETDPQAAMHNLHARISELRKALEPELSNGRQSAYIKNAGKGRYRFSKAPTCWLDTEAFRELKRRVERLKSQGAWAKAVEELKKAASLVFEDFLTEENYEEWTIPHRRYWRDERAKVLEDLSRGLSAFGEYTLALDACSQLLCMDPLHEPAHRMSMALHSLNGDKSNAILGFQTACSIFNRELNSNPSQETLSLFEEIQNDDVPALKRELLQNDWRLWAIPKMKYKSREAERLRTKGHHLLRKGNWRAASSALRYFRGALALCPHDADLHVDEGTSYFQLAWYHHQPCLNASRAERSIERALDLNSSSSQAYAIQAMIQMSFRWDFSRANVNLNRALELDPVNPYALRWRGWLLAIQGDLPEAQRAMLQAIDSHPLFIGNYVKLSWLFFLDGNYDHMIETAQEGLELEPAHNELYRMLAIALEKQEEFGKAHKMLSHAFILSHNDVMDLSALGIFYANRGRTRDAERILNLLENTSETFSPYHTAVVHAALGHWNRMRQQLELSLQDRAWPLTLANRDRRLKDSCTTPYAREIFESINSRVERQCA